MKGIFLVLIFSFSSLVHARSFETGIKRLRSGETETLPFLITPGANGYLEFAVDIDTVDYENLDSRVDIEFYRLDGIDWKFVAGMTWIGGQFNDPDSGLNPPVTISITAFWRRGKRMKGRFYTYTPFTYGFTVSN